MIPKIIHYIWFGGEKKPDIVLRCIASWKKYMPDWEIREWSEENYDVEKSVYMRQAYKQKMWAFVSDYARFDILAKYGGVYLDTDVEILKPIPKEILEKEAFTGVESTGYVSPGLVFGCSPSYWIVIEMVKHYEQIEFDGKAKKPMTVNKRITDKLIKKGFIINDTYQEINGLAIYPSSYFCGFDLDIHEECVTEETVMLHHYAGSWLKKNCFKNRVKIVLKKILGIKRYRKMIIFKKHTVKKLKNL